MSSTLKTQLKNVRKNSGFSLENGILHYSGTAEDFSSAIKSKLKTDPTIDGQISLKNAAGELVVISIKEGSLVNGKKTKAKKDPNAPKRPLTSFFIFTQEQRPKLVANNPDATAPEIGKLAGAAWKALSEAQRAPYNTKAAALKSQYAAALASYKASSGSPASSTTAPASDDEEASEEEVEVAPKPKKVSKKAAPKVVAEETPKKTKKVTPAAAPTPVKSTRKQTKKTA